MNNPFQDYLTLLNQIRTELEHLSELARKKVAAVRSDDLTALDQIMKQEQASSLVFRGIEQKQSTLLTATGLKGIPLSALADNFPPKMRLEAKKTIDDLQTQYKIYQSSSEVARNTLECNLHQIEKFIASVDAAPVEGPGYQAPEPELPSSMKTDFRA